MGKSRHPSGEGNIHPNRKPDTNMTLARCSVWMSLREFRQHFKPDLEGIQDHKYQEKTP